MKAASSPVDESWNPLEYASWIRSVARGLVQNEADEDDIVQDTLVTALDRPPRDTSSLKSWFFAVVRSRHISRLRSESRRARREQKVAEGLAVPLRQVPTPDELHEQAALQQEIGAAVHELDEIYREVVLLHYFHGFSTSEIAEELDLKPGTVRQRLSRARERLRERLQDRFGSGWYAACVALARTAPPPGALVATGGLGGLGLWTSLAAGAALVAGSFLWLDPPEPGGGVHAAAPKESSAPAAGEREAPAVPAPAPEGARRDLAPGPRPGWFRGRVVLDAPGGPPAAGALVEAVLGRAASRAVAGEDGRFELPCPVDPADWRGWLGASLPGLAGSLRFDLRPGAAEEAVLVLHRDGLPVAVRVVDEVSGRARPGVPVELAQGPFRSRAETDEDGLAVLLAPGPGPAEVRVDPRRSTRAGRVRLAVQVDGTDPEVVLRTAFFPDRVHLLARDARSGALLAEARFRLQPEGAPADATAWPLLRAEGGLLEAALPPGDPARILVQAPGYAPQLVVPAAWDPGQPLEVALEPLRGVELRLLDGGRPAPAGTRLRWRYELAPRTLPAGREELLPWRGAAELAFAVRGDQEGRAVLGLPGDLGPVQALEFRLEAPDGRVRELGRVRPGDLPREEPWLLDLSPATAELSFLATDPSGAPVATVLQVEATAADAGARLRSSRELRSRRPLSTGPDGRARLEVPVPATVRWSAAGGAAAAEILVTEAGSLEVPVAVPAAGLAIEGRLILDRPLDPAAGDVLSRLLVLRDPADGRVLATALPGEEGRFRFEGLEPGLWELSLRWSRRLEPRLVPAGTSGLDLVAPPLVDWDLQAVDAAGRPLRNVSLLGITEDGERVEERLPEGRLLQTASLRRWRTLVFQRPGYAPAVLDLPAEPGPLWRAEAVLGPGRPLRVGPVAGARSWEWVREPGGEVLLVLPAREDGSLQWEDAPLEAVLLRPRGGDGRPLDLRARVAAGSAGVPVQASILRDGGE